MSLSSKKLLNKYKGLEINPKPLRIIVYEPKTQQLREPTVVKLLDLIACTEDTETAWVDYDKVEELSDACINKWCDKEGINPEEIVRECTLYLKPSQENDTVKDWLNFK